MWMRGKNEQLLDLRDAAVDEQLDAGDVAAVVRGQERDGAGDFVRRSSTLQGNAGGALLELLDLLLVEAQLGVAPGGDEAGADGVDADAAALEIHRPRAGERAHRGLGGAVHAEGLLALARGDGRIEDDGGTLLE